MKKTIVYLPDELGRVVGEVGRSEAELIRDAIERMMRESTPPRPRLPLFASGDATLAERVDEELAGRGALPGFGESAFGER